jgi:hypothetical protein
MQRGWLGQHPSIKVWSGAMPQAAPATRRDFEPLFSPRKVQNSAGPEDYCILEIDFERSSNSRVRCALML